MAFVPRVALILGARVLQDGRPSKALERRALYGAGLWRDGAVDLIVVSGGARDGLPSEAEVGAQICSEAGVLHEAILQERSSGNTMQNLTLSRDLLAELQPYELTVVTDAYHAPRVRLILRRIGMPAQVSGVAMVDVRADKRVKAYLREALAYLFYLVGGRA